MGLVTSWDEIIEKFRPLLFVTSNAVWFYPSSGLPDEIKQRLDDSKIFFVNAVAHELFTPITAMLGLVEIAKEGENVQENLLKIEKHLLRMQRIVEQLLLLSKIEREDYIPTFAEIELDLFIKTFLSEFEQRRKEKNLRFEISVAGNIKVDPEAFKIALRNFISNSIKYSKNDGVIIIRTENNFLIIEDRGVGIPEKDLKYVTSRFYRASNARNYSGSGLGLAIAKHLLRKFGIDWAIHSKVNLGTTVFIDLGSIKI
ncbi:sensor histidine kinase [Pseudothermotoga thermarum]|uniref:histidine kinase n=1 Tax=Pseudothermotoga thermarum DSM 5069 TaxID=688269 RepID=F7YXI9_9THEM|nr:HAMP domain-containing sensor histidine kinase [Pseudothermotoga thermarum]AEH50630.1 histidine kinase [Pseudothermotoga thermarum DSM 5069]